MGGMLLTGVGPYASNKQMTCSDKFGIMTFGDFKILTRIKKGEKLPNRVPPRKKFLVANGVLINR